MLVNNIKDIDTAFKENKKAIGANSKLDCDLGDRLVRCCDFYKNEEINKLVKIKASELRNLIVKHSQDSVGERLFLQGVFIEGRLNIEGLSGSNGSPLPDLYFIQCFFDNGICFSGATLRHLSLRGSRFLVDLETQVDFDDAPHHIQGVNAKIHRSLDLSHVRPLNDDSSGNNFGFKIEDNHSVEIDYPSYQISANTLTADLRNTYILRSLICSNSTFAEQYGIAVRKKTTIGKRYAFNISGVTVEKNLILCPRFKVQGGLSAKTLHCKNEAWLVGCDITSKYRYRGESRENNILALDFQSAQFDKFFSISQDMDFYRSKIEGDISFYSAKATNVKIQTLKLEHGSLFFSHFRCGDFYLSSYRPKFGGMNFLEPSRGKTKFYTKNAIIDYLYINLDNVDLLNLEGTVFHKLEIHGEYDEICLNNATIKRECILACEALDIKIESANIDGDLNLRQWVSYKQNDGPWPLLTLKQTIVNGSIDVGQIEKREHIKTLRYSLLCCNYDLVVSESHWLTPDFSKYEGDSKKNVFIAYLENKKDKREFYRLSGTSNFFHRLNKYIRISYDDEPAAIEFLILFCAYTWGESGPFRIVTNEQLINSDGHIIDNENIERPNIKCIGVDGLVINQKVIGKMRAYPNLTGCNGLFSDFIDFRITLGESNVSSFLTEIRSQLNDKTIDINETDFQHFIAATVIYNSVIFIGLFGLLHPENENNHVQLLAEFPICSIYDDCGSDGNLMSSVGGSSANHLWRVDVKSFNDFINQSGGRGSMIKVNNSEKDSNDKKGLQAEDFFPNLKFIDGRNTEIFAPSINKEEHEIVLWKAWGVTRQAFVDLTDVSCELLIDSSGRAWGDEVIFQTDRFRFRNLVRRDIQSNTQKLSIKKVLKEFDVAPNDLAKRSSEKGATTYQSHHDLSFFEQRLIWLCRYHHKDIPLTTHAERPDSGTFRRIARIYRSNGLTEAANYIDEARIRIEHKIYRENVKLADWRTDWQIMLACLGIALVCGAVSCAVGFYTWAAVSSMVAAIVFVWNIITKNIVKHILGFLARLIGFAFRLCFRYGLSLLRPVMTILIFVGIGSWGTQYLDSKGFMILETTVVAQSVGDGWTTEKDTPYINTAPSLNVSLDPNLFFNNKLGVTPVTNVRCGNTIEYAIYALDVFIPLVNLNQEDRCMIRPFDELTDVPYEKILSNHRSEYVWDIIFDHPTTWRILQTLYILLGWVIISASLLTFSGYLQRQAESSESEQQNK